MKVTNKLTTDYMIMYINIPTAEDVEHYAVEIEHRDMDKDIYYIEILDLDSIEQVSYSHFKINSLYEVLNDRELNEREDLILLFIANRLRLD